MLKLISLLTYAGLATCAILNKYTTQGHNFSTQLMQARNSYLICEQVTVQDKPLRITSLKYRASNICAKYKHKSNQSAHTQLEFEWILWHQQGHMQTWSLSQCFVLCHGHCAPRLPYKPPVQWLDFSISQAMTVNFRSQAPAHCQCSPVLGLKAQVHAASAVHKLACTRRLHTWRHCGLGL